LILIYNFIQRSRYPNWTNRT